jgi:ferrous iron transport protein B
MDAPEPVSTAVVPEGEGAEAVSVLEEADEWSFLGSVGEAFASIPAAFADLGSSLADPLGVSVISDDEATVAEEVEADGSIFATMRSYFNNDVHAAYAYLLFILIYFPCVAALGAILRELGRLFGWICIAYLTVLAWITATLYYQIAAAHQVVWIVVPLAMLAAMVAGFSLLRNKVKIS